MLDIKPRAGLNTFITLLLKEIKEEGFWEWEKYQRAVYFDIDFYNYYISKERVARKDNLNTGNDSMISKSIQGIHFRVNFKYLFLSHP